MIEIDLNFIQVNAFIQGYAKAMEHVSIMKTQPLLSLERYFNIEKATDKFKKKLEEK